MENATTQKCDARTEECPRRAQTRSKLLLPRRLFVHLLGFFDDPEDVYHLAAISFAHRSVIRGWLRVEPLTPDDLARLPGIPNDVCRFEWLREIAIRKTPLRPASELTKEERWSVLRNFVNQKHNLVSLKGALEELNRIRPRPRLLAQVKLGEGFRAAVNRLSDGALSMTYMFFLDSVAIPNETVDRHGSFVLTSSLNVECDLVQVDRDDRRTRFRATYLPLPMYQYTNFAVYPKARVDAFGSVSQLPFEEEATFCFYDLYERRFEFPRLAEEVTFLIRALDGCWLLGMCGLVGRAQ